MNFNSVTYRGKNEKFLPALPKRFEMENLKPIEINRVQVHGPLPTVAFFFQARLLVHVSLIGMAI